MALLDQGLTQKAVAERLGVSPAAVSKRLKRLPPPSFTQLTPKEKKFVECRAKGVSQTESVCQAYDVSEVILKVVDLSRFQLDDEDGNTMDVTPEDDEEE